MENVTFKVQKLYQNDIKLSPLYSEKTEQVVFIYNYLLFFYELC